jgi:hypothetical protein
VFELKPDYKQASDDREEVGKHKSIKEKAGSD